MSTKEDQINYINKFLVPHIVKSFKNEILLDHRLEDSTGLDGFMSYLYKIYLTTKNTETNETREHNVIAKLMRGDATFRKLSKSNTLMANEILIYSKILPYYDKLSKELNVSINTEEWVPHVYFAKFGQIEGLNDCSSQSLPECVLALENLQPKGYKCGPRLCLDEKHLLMMMKPIAEYHSFTYLMRIKNDENLNNFIQDIIPLSWAPSKNATDEISVYDYVYRPAFERFFIYYDKKISQNNDDEMKDENFMKNCEKLRKYINEPTQLLEKYREIDETFSVILHGDYNRNNVLFKYENPDSFDNPIDIKMIDFQELRYGTPSIDLSFFMYINADPTIRNEIWMKLLEQYHKIMINSLSHCLKVFIEHEYLKPYSFNNFYKHFKKFGFYGAIVCMHFLPWMYCSEEELSELSYLYETDLSGEKFRKLSIEAGGDTADEIIMNIVKHASKMGYMDFI